MPQFRLTQKFAEDIKIRQLDEPQLVKSLLDDWVIDRVIIRQRKIAFVTHVRSLLSFPLFYQEAGGAKNIPKCIGNLLSLWLDERDLKDFSDQAKNLFEQPFVFCKTFDRKLLGYVNGFKRFFKFRMSCYRSFESVDWEEEESIMNNRPMVVSGHIYPSPTERMLQLIGKGMVDLF